MTNIVFIAPPAAGKGSMSELLQKEYHYTHISTGDLLREKAKENNEFGHKIKDLIDQGKFASDEDITRLLKEKLLELQEQPFILDGYPRNLEQAKILDEILKESGKDIIVIYLSISDEHSMKRALGRLSCPKCKAGYNSYEKEFQPLKEGICDHCGTTLEKRVDDTEDTYKERLKTYYEKTNPLIAYYKDKNLLTEINVERSTKEIFADIVSLIEEA